MQATPSQGIIHRTSETSFVSLLTSSSQSVSPPRHSYPQLQLHNIRSIPQPSSRSRSVSRTSVGMISSTPASETPLISVQFASRRIKEGSELDNDTIGDTGSSNGSDHHQRLRSNTRPNVDVDSDISREELVSIDSAQLDDILQSEGSIGNDANNIATEDAEIRKEIKLENVRLCDLMRKICYDSLKALDYEPVMFGESPPLKFELDYEKLADRGKGRQTAKQDTNKQTVLSPPNSQLSVETLDSLILNNDTGTESMDVRSRVDREIIPNVSDSDGSDNSSFTNSDLDLTDSDMEYFQDEDVYDEEEEALSVPQHVEDDDIAISGDSAVDDSLIDDEFDEFDSGSDLDSDDYITDGESLNDSFDEFEEQKIMELREKQDKDVQDIKEITFLPSRRRKSSATMSGKLDMSPTLNTVKDKKEETENNLRLLFAKKEIGEPTKGLVSKLSSLINTTTISLDYYKYVGEKQNGDDELKMVTIWIPVLAQEIECKINTSVSIVELIGYALWKADDITASTSNSWKCYLGDDGEIEDDFGVLDRTREVKSYGGADEFVIVECTEEEKIENEKITPSPIEKIGESGTQMESGDSSTTNGVSMMDMVNSEGNNSIIGGSPESLESDITKQMRVATKMKTSNSQQKQLQQLRKGKKGTERKKKLEESSTSSALNLQSQKLTKTDTNKGDRLNLRKTRNTIQSILHNTADKYENTKKELFTGDHQGDEQGYYTWTVWRRQHMSFKTKMPKTLTIDGYQIYLLPFNEYKGSWYESKSYNFHISQVLKVSINAKVSNYFKIVIKKNTEGVVKKYYLEAVDDKECREIVGRIRKHAKSYK